MSVQFDLESKGPKGKSEVAASGKLLKFALSPVKGCWVLFYTFFGFSSLHGFVHITRRTRHPVEKGLWAVTCALALYGAVTLGLQTWRRFQENPTVVSMERNYKDWNTSFPAVAICPTAKFSEVNLRRTLDEYESVKDKSRLRKLLIELSEASYGTFDKVTIELEQFDPRQYVQAIAKIAFPFQYKVSNSNPENYNVFRLNPFITEIGICYSYNSDSTYYNDPGYWEQDRWTSLGRFPIFQSNPLDGDIFAQLRTMNTGYKLYVFSNSEFPDIGMSGLQADNNTYKTLDLTTLSTVSTESTKLLSVPQRRCRLQHESELDISPVYSYNLCRQECRRKMSFTYCKCVPFFYRPTKKYPVCDKNGMLCLNKYTEILMKLVDPDTGKKVPCSCYPLCDESNFFVDADNTMMWSLGTNLKIGLIKYPKFRLKRDVIFGYSDLLVSIGGTFGLFLGCSILSVAEAVYFFLFRPIYLWNYRIPLAFS